MKSATKQLPTSGTYAGSNELGALTASSALPSSSTVSLVRAAGATDYTITVTMHPQSNALQHVPVYLLRSAAPSSDLAHATPVVEKIGLGCLGPFGAR